MLSSSFKNLDNSSYSTCSFESISSIIACPFSILGVSGCFCCDKAVAVAVDPVVVGMGTGTVIIVTNDGYEGDDGDDDDSDA